MQAWMVWDHTLCTVGEYHRRAIGVHRRGVVETAAIGVGIVESSCPVSRYRAGAGHQSHGAAGASGEGAGQIQQGNGGVDRETDQPGIVVPTIDDPGFLKDLRQTGNGVIGDVHDGAFLIHWFCSLVMIKAGIDRTDVTKLLPGGRVMATTKIHAPDDTAGRELMRVGREALKMFERWRTWNLRHASKVAREC